MTDKTRWPLFFRRGRGLVDDGVEMEREERSEVVEEVSLFHLRFLSSFAANDLFGSIRYQRREGVDRFPALTRLRGMSFRRSW